MYHFALKPSSATMPIAITIMNTNKNFDSLFTSKSNFPTFYYASFEFISDLVSFPV